MNFSAFDAIMREGIIVRWILPEVLAAAALIGIAAYFISKYRHGTASDRSIGFMLVMTVAFIVFALITASDTLPMMHDLKSQNYASVHGVYECEVKPGTQGVQLRLCVTLEDGEIFGLMHAMPIGMELNGVPLPEGKYMATVWYAAESHCIVAFIPDEPIPED